MALHAEGKKVKFTKAEQGTTGTYKPTWEQEQNVLSFRKLLLRRHLLRWLRHTDGAVYVPFMGDGDIADVMYRKREIYGADLDGDRVQTARSRFPGVDIRVADCDDTWPFEDVAGPFAIADFDAFTEPYAAFRQFWRAAPKADRLAMFFTDGHRQGLLRTGWFDAPDGQKIKLGEGLRGEAKLKAPYYWKYLPLYVWPYFDGLFAGEWRMLDRWRYQRDMMIYWGVALEKEAMTVDQQDEFLEHMRSGMRRGAAAEVMELTRIEVQSFIRSTPEYERLVIDAEELATEHVEEALYQAAVSGSVPAAKLWLERARPARTMHAPVAVGDEDPQPTPVYEDELEAIMRLTTE